MALFNPSNQLIQIDTGNVRTYCWNPSSGNALYPNIGQNQVLGQRYVASINSTTSNPSGAPAVYMLVKYSSTANPAVVGFPAPVYWADETYTTVTGVSTESLLGLNGVAGYLMVNSGDLSTLTNTILNGSYVFIQVAGYLSKANAPGSGAGVGNTLIGAATNFASAGVASGTASTQSRFLGIQATAVASGACDVLVTCDLF